MEYNKKKFLNNQFFHGLKKHWLVVSMALLGMMGATSFTTRGIHASSVENHGDLTHAQLNHTSESQPRSSLILQQRSNQSAFQTGPQSNQSLNQNRSLSNSTNDSNQRLTYDFGLTLQYEDMNGKLINSQVKQIPISGTVGTSYNINYRSYLPNNYHLAFGSSVDYGGKIHAKFLSEKSGTFTFQENPAKIFVQYVDPSNKVVEEHMIEGPNGQVVNVTRKLPLPSGYSYVSGDPNYVYGYNPLVARINVKNTGTKKPSTAPDQTPKRRSNGSNQQPNHSAASLQPLQPSRPSSQPNTPNGISSSTSNPNSSSNSMNSYPASGSSVNSSSNSNSDRSESTSQDNRVPNNNVPNDTPGSNSSHNASQGQSSNTDGSAADPTDTNHSAAGQDSQSTNNSSHPQTDNAKSRKDRAFRKRFYQHTLGSQSRNQASDSAAKQGSQDADNYVRGVDSARRNSAKASDDPYYQSGYDTFNRAKASQQQNSLPKTGESHHPISLAAALLMVLSFVTSASSIADYRHRSF